MCFRRSSQHLFSHSFVRASLNMHGVWSRAGASGTPQTAQAVQAVQCSAGPSRYDGAQLSPHHHHPGPQPLPPRLASHVPLRIRLLSPRPSRHLGRIFICFVCVDSNMTHRLIITFNCDVVGCPQEMKTHRDGPLRTRDGRSEGGAGL